MGEGGLREPATSFSELRGELKRETRSETDLRNPPLSTRCSHWLEARSGEAGPAPPWAPPHLSPPPGTPGGGCGKPAPPRGCLIHGLKRAGEGGLPLPGMLEGEGEEEDECAGTAERKGGLPASQSRSLRTAVEGVGELRGFILHRV